MKKIIIFMVLMLGVNLLVACGDSSTAVPANGSNTTAPATATLDPNRPPIADDTPGGDKLRTVKPFFTPGSLASPSPVGPYTLAFNSKPDGMALEASVTGLTAPSAGANEWQLQITNAGAVKYTKNPRDQSRAVMQEHYLNPDKLKTLLTQLDGLGVLTWPDITPPKGTPGVARSLALYLKGRPKLISDLSGATGDNLDKMLDAIKGAVEAAPTRNSP